MATFTEEQKKCRANFMLLIEEAEAHSKLAQLMFGDALMEVSDARIDRFHLAANVIPMWLDRLIPSMFLTPQPAPKLPLPTSDPAARFHVRMHTHSPSMKRIIYFDTLI